MMKFGDGSKKGKGKELEKKNDKKLSKWKRENSPDTEELIVEFLSKVAQSKFYKKHTKI